MSPELDEAARLGQIAGERLQRSREKLRHRLAAACERDVLDVANILDAGLLRRDQHLEVVPAADRRAAADRHRGRIRLDAVHQVGQRLDLAVRGDRDDAVIGAHAADPAHLVHRVAGKGVLREPGGGGRRGGDDQVVVVAALVDDLGEGHPAAAARQVHHLHRRRDQAQVLQCLAHLPAGEVPAAAGVGGRDALRLLGREVLRGRAQWGAEGESGGCEPAQKRCRCHGISSIRCGSSRAWCVRPAVCPHSDRPPPGCHAPFGAPQH